MLKKWSETLVNKTIYIYIYMGHVNLWAQVKEFKMEIKNKFYIESITFATF